MSKEMDHTEPAAPLLSPAGKKPSREFAATTTQRILVIDDEQEIRQSMVMLLELLGHRAHAAQDASTAFTALENFQPDIVFLDLGMPRMNGQELAKQIRQVRPSLSLVAMSGYQQNSWMARTAADVFDAFLLKPATVSDIEKTLVDHSKRAASNSR